MPNFPETAYCFDEVQLDTDIQLILLNCSVLLSAVNLSLKSGDSHFRYKSQFPFLFPLCIRFNKKGGILLFFELDLEILLVLMQHVFMSSKTSINTLSDSTCIFILTRMLLYRQ